MFSIWLSDKQIATFEGSNVPVFLGLAVACPKVPSYGWRVVLASRDVLRPRLDRLNCENKVSFYGPCYGDVGSVPEDPVKLCDELVDNLINKCSFGDLARFKAM